ncbi:Tubulin-specific chaperone E [Leucoagaricus sp. SymC.cos]|nr:Tubulin-specific chaperone E [Leucoagaricus sp. SymC.cos]
MMEPGQRITFMGQIGTVRFSGPVEGTSGTWLGIEWDDPARGKHDGARDGKQYFTCLVPGAGSFLRHSPNIYLGKSFLEALKSKYIESLHGTKSQEVVVLGSSRGAIQVEAVNLDKIRDKLSKLSSLREVSLDGEGVAKGDPQGKIRDTCPNIRGLDLSKSLIHSWSVIAAITRELPSLQRLYVNQNRFRQSPGTDILEGCFNSLAELRLSNTLMKWKDILAVVACMPKLRDLECGYNKLTDASFDLDGHLNLTTSVQTLNLDSNQICGWTSVYLAFLVLARVILANNQITSIPFPAPEQGLTELKHLSLSFNRLKLWSDIHALAAWAPSLESLTLVGNPIMTDHAQNARPLVIARLATLRILDGAVISGKERRDAELYYLSYIVNHGVMAEDERCQEHPRWQELCLRYGKPDETLSKLAPDTLKSRLSELKLYRCSASMESMQVVLNEKTEIVIRVLPTMTLKILRSKIRKALGCGLKANIAISLVMNDHSLVPLDEDRDNQDLSWIGLDAGSQLLCMVK